MKNMMINEYAYRLAKIEIGSFARAFVLGYFGWERMAGHRQCDTSIRSS